MKKIANILFFLLITLFTKAQENSFFTISPTCLKAATPLQFQATDPTATSWQWDFGDGSTSTLQNPTHIYTDFGYFCVSLMASNACGDSSLTQTIYVQTKDCPCDTAYQIENGWIVSGAQTLDNSTFGTGIVKVKGDIVVTSGSSLSISLVELQMYPTSRIIVERGANLSLLECRLTSLNDCGMWHGIEVWGSSDSASYAGLNGKIQLLGGVHIDNAHIGILSGKRNMDYACDPTSGYKFDLDYSGGIVDAHYYADYNCIFTNNGIDIQFTRKNVAEGSANRLNNMYFVCNAQLQDLHYNSANFNPYPNTQNPWAGHANQYQRGEAGILVENTDGFDVTECTFRNKQIGILSFDSKYNVFGSEFKRMVYGIRIENTGPSVGKRHEISDCEFDSIPGVINSHGSAIHIKGGRFDFVHDNTFSNQNALQSLNNIAIRTNWTNSFKIGENGFNNFKTGVVVRNSGLNSSYVGALGPIWDGNEYFQCLTNIRTAGFNPRLRLKCNMCDNPAPAYYDVNFRNASGYLGNQGSYAPSFFNDNLRRKFAAGNEFQPYPVLERRYITSVSNYNYYHHIEDKTIPTLYPGTAWINRYNLGVTKDLNSSACPSPLGTISVSIGSIFSVFPFTVLDSLDNENELLNITLTQQLMELDGNATGSLLADIYSDPPPGQLKNTLLDHSPLSDTVLIALCEQFPLSVGDFKLVMLANMPVSKYVEPWFYETLLNLPPGIDQQLLNAQANNEDAYCPAATLREIDENNIMREQWQNDIIIALTDTINNDKATAIALLEQDTAVSSQQVLAGTYLLDGDYAAADAKLDTLAGSTEVLDSWIELTGFISDLYAIGNTFYDLDSASIVWLYDMAYACPEIHATSYAQSILYLLYRDEFPECDEFNNRNFEYSGPASLSGSRECDATLYTAYPSPAKEKLNIPYYVPEGIEYLAIVDGYGHDIAMYELRVGRNELQIDVSGYAEGTYFYGIRTATGNCLFKKFVIIK